MTTRLFCPTATRRRCRTDEDLGKSETETEPEHVLFVPRSFTVPMPHLIVQLGHEPSCVRDKLQS